MDDGKLFLGQREGDGFLLGGIQARVAERQRLCGRGQWDSVRLWLGTAGDCSRQTEPVEGSTARGGSEPPWSQPGDTGATCWVSHQERKWQTTDHRPNAAGRLLP